MNNDMKNKIAVHTCFFILMMYNSGFPQFPSANDTLAAIDSAACTLSVSSQPMDADVYLDSILVGKTPLVLDKVIPGEHLIDIFNPKFEPWRTKISPRGGEEIKISAVLSVRTGVLYFQCSPENTQIYLDKTLLSQGMLQRYDVQFGLHEIEARSDSLSRSQKKSFFLTPSAELVLKIRLGYHSLTAMYLSMILPGSGQIRAGSLIKGGAFTAGTLGLFILCANLNHDYSGKLAVYNDLRDAYLAADNESDIIRLRNETKDAKSDADKTYRIRNWGYSAFVGLYLLNVLDALIFNDKEDEIRIIPKGSAGKNPIKVTTNLQQLSVGLSIKL